jgi:hypothetical protein
MVILAICSEKVWTISVWQFKGRSHGRERHLLVVLSCTFLIIICSLSIPGKQLSQWSRQLAPPSTAMRTSTNRREAKCTKSFYINTNIYIYIYICVYNSVTHNFLRCKSNYSITILLLTHSLKTICLKMLGSSVVVKALCYKPEGRGFQTR